MTEPSRAVFLSYASQDAAAAQRICEALRSAGIEVWFDQSELRGGDAWDQTIRRQIHDCALFLAVVSAHTDERDEGYFRREWNLAVERTVDMAGDKPFLLPVVVDGTLDATARVPDKFRHIQWTRLAEGNTPPAFVQQVLRLLSPRPVSQGRTPSPILAARDPTRAASRWSRAVPWLIGVVAVIVFGYFAVDKLVTPRRHTADGSASVPTAQLAVTTPSAIPEKSIAVLPFVDMSEKKDQEYFADGMAEELLDVLAKIPALQVTGRTSSFQFKGRSEDLRVIGEKLGVKYIVEGSVRKAGARLRVTAQLVDARSDTQIWADTYDREYGDILNIQGQIATGIARALQLAVVSEEPRPAYQLHNSEAYTYYLRGRAALDRGDAQGIREATSNFDQALALEPTFARAAEALALAYFLEASYAISPSSAVWPLAVDMAERTLRLDPRSALARVVIAMFNASYKYDWASANAELDKILALHSRDPMALYLSAWLAFDLGRHSDAARLQDASLTIDPLNPESYNNNGYIHYLTGNLDAAERDFRRGLDISPSYGDNHRMLGLILLLRGQPDAALKEVESSSGEDVDEGFALVYYALGRRAESDAALARATRAVGESAPVYIAEVHAYRGERDQAIEWLTKSIAIREVDLVHKIKDEPLLASVRGDPRFKTLLRKMNLPET